MTISLQFSYGNVKSLLDNRAENSIAIGANTSGRVGKSVL